jgi:PKD repeat protein
MQTQRSFSLSAIVITAVLTASCTMQKQEAPPLTGPSGFGTTVDVAVTPDVLQGDGASQATVMLSTFDSNGQPLGNVSLLTEIRVNGSVVDFGSLSARSIVTRPDGRASLMYTAPRIQDQDVIVEIAVTPITNNAANHIARTAQIRLVPTGIRLPPSDLVPAFSMTPTNPAQGQTVLFDAQESKGTIAEYRWDFGDGGSSHGQTASHAYSDVGTYFVRLTLVDTNGRTSSISRSISVGQSAAPTADFSFSPANPQPNDEVRFNASASTASAGRRIVSYSWDFGDGGSGSGVQASRRYTQARTYNVTLTVTDDIGRTSTVTKSVDVALPDEDDGGESPN